MRPGPARAASSSSSSARRAPAGSPRPWCRAGSTRGPDDATALTVLHEFGHVVDAIGLDVAGELAVQKLFQASPDWLDCFFYRPLGCVPPEELLADQFAFWATGISPVDEASPCETLRILTA